MHDTIKLQNKFPSNLQSSADSRLSFMIQRNFMTLRASIILITLLTLSCSLQDLAGNTFLTRDYNREIHTYTNFKQQSLQFYHYIPDHSNHSKAVILWHGGGWKQGSKQAMDLLCKRYAQAGIHCFAPDYRLWKDSTDTPVRAKEDALSFWNHLQENKAVFGLKKAKWWVGGSSAGGNLAAHIPGAPRILISAVLKTHGPNAFDNNTLDSSSRINMDLISALKSLQRSRKEYDDNKGLNTPTILFHSDSDYTVPLIGSLEYCELIGSNCEIHIIQGVNHTSLTNDEILRDSLIETSIKWMKKVF